MERICYGDVVNLQFLHPEETDGLRGTLSISVKGQNSEYDLHFHDPGLPMFKALHKKAAKLADVWKKKYAQV